MSPQRQNTSQSVDSVNSSIISEQQTQVDDGHYLNVEKLKAYLTKNYGNQWKLQYKMEKWIITAPEQLNEVLVFPLGANLNHLTDLNRKLSRNHPFEWIIGEESDSVGLLSKWHQARQVLGRVCERISI